MTNHDQEIAVATVLQSAKYRHICPDLVRRTAFRFVDSGASIKDLVKLTKNRLHQIAGAYLASTPNYSRWRAELLKASGKEALRALALTWMQSHASTRERLSTLGNFYTDVLSDVGPIDSVIDIACGLNPLAVPWMGLAPGARYSAYDIYGDMTEFLTEYLRAAGVDGCATAIDCAANPPEEKADLAIILKFLPVLEQIDKGNSLTWLKRINARYILISYPTRSLGGRGKGMAQNYESRFLEIIGSEPWAVTKRDFDNELCFLVKK